MVSINVDISGDLQKMLQEDAKQLRFAAVRALTRTANNIKEELGNEMRRAFDRPTSYTLNSLRTRPATKDDLSASVTFREFAGKGTPASVYLLPQVDGGSRQMKRFERSIRAAGLLPAGMYAVPGQGADLDKHGNMNRGQIMKILSALRASSDPMQNRGKGQGKGKRRLEEYFVSMTRGRSAHLPPGIYRRMPSERRVVPIMMFVSKVAYRRRFDFDGIAQKTADRNFERHFWEALDAAWATRR